MNVSLRFVKTITKRITTIRNEKKLLILVDFENEHKSNQKWRERLKSSIM